MQGRCLDHRYYGDQVTKEGKNTAHLQWRKQHRLWRQQCRWQEWHLVQVEHKCFCAWLQSFWSINVDYIITQVVLAFWLVLAYDVLEDRRTIDVIISKFFPLCFEMAESFENLDNVLHDWARDEVQKSLVEALNRNEKHSLAGRRKIKPFLF